jgi:hypothetical protein
MAEQALDLWPKLETVNIRTPLNVLKQQAALLGKHTGNILEARVITQPMPPGFLHRFMIEAPIMAYQIELFSVTHDLNLYPVRTMSDGADGESLASEENLVEWLKAKLNSAATKRILATLMAQAES